MFDEDDATAAADPICASCAPLHRVRPGLIAAGAASATRRQPDAAHKAI